MEKGRVEFEERVKELEADVTHAIWLLQETRLDHEHENDCIEGRECLWCEIAMPLLAKYTVQDQETL